jgi:ankyrin repeat protein
MDNQDRKFMTALHYAASNNHSAVVDVLCRSGANLEETNMQGETALNLACSNMHLDVVRILVGYNANYNKPDHGGVYPLQRLSIDGTENIALNCCKRNNALP